LPVARKAGQVVLLALVTSIIWTASASAQTREFVGKLDSVNDKKVIVDNRKGDKITFNKTDTTTVEGEGKTKWEELKKSDWVTIDWMMKDNPRKAYKVTVMPAPKEAGEDAE
jgi:hypothetical protein